MVTKLLEKAIEIEGLIRIIRDGNPLPETYTLLSNKAIELAEDAMTLEEKATEAELEADKALDVAIESEEEKATEAELEADKDPDEAIEAEEGKASEAELETDTDPDVAIEAEEEKATEAELEAEKTSNVVIGAEEDKASEAELEAEKAPDVAIEAEEEKKENVLIPVAEKTASGISTTRIVSATFDEFKETEKEDDDILLSFEEDCTEEFEVTSKEEPILKIATENKESTDTIYFKAEEETPTTDSDVEIDTDDDVEIATDDDVEIATDDDVEIDTENNDEIPTENNVETASEDDIETSTDKDLEIVTYHNVEIKEEQAKPTIKRKVKLRSAFSLNDRFLYSRELFEGNMKTFDSTLDFLEGIDDFSILEEYFYNEMEWDKKNPSVNSFMEILRHQLKK